ncbi:MAG TPA: hypothetical protein VL358_03150 [Caulobacteraceae bacterium]|jgi:hypothetical protein|nr:hypothetical protein [Caulobacteraceae bacterium]
METVPRKLVVAVAFILVGLAGLGVYQGLRRSGAGDADAVDAGLPPLTAPGAAGAKTASAITDPQTPALTEAQVREIARQEARAALGQPRTAAAPASSEGVDAGPTSSSTKPVVGPPPPRPAQPALQSPTGPAAGPAAESGQPPLF